MERKEYNGWTNYETWLVKLWMDNDEGASNYWRESAETFYEAAKADHTFTKDEAAALALSESIKAHHEEMAENKIGDTSGWITDLVNAALSEVNWHEIAVHLIEEVASEAAKA